MLFLKISFQLTLLSSKSLKTSPKNSKYNFLAIINNEISTSVEHLPLPYKHGNKLQGELLFFHY